MGTVSMDSMMKVWRSCWGEGAAVLDVKIDPCWLSYIFHPPPRPQILQPPPLLQMLQDHSKWPLTNAKWWWSISWNMCDIHVSNEWICFCQGWQGFAAELAQLIHTLAGPCNCRDRHGERRCRVYAAVQDEPGEETSSRLTKQSHVYGTPVEFAS